MNEDVAPELGEPQRLPGKADAEGWRRLHPLSPLLRGGLALVIIAGIIIANFRDRILDLFIVQRVRDSGLLAEDPDAQVSEQDVLDFITEQRLWLVVLGVVLGVILLIVLFSWLSWRFQTYRISDDAVEARSGVVFRQHRRAPLERIQGVNLHRSLLARVLGLTKIEIQTAGQGGKVELSYLGHGDAKLVRTQILRSAAQRRNERNERLPEHIGADDAPQTAVDFAGRSYAAPSGQLDARLQDAVDFDIDASARGGGLLVKVPVRRLLGSLLLSWEMFSLVVMLIAVPLLSLIWGWGFLAVLLPVIIVSVSLLIGQFNRGFNFTLTRSSDGVRVGAGLTATTTESLPFGRIHAVEARQPLGWRLVGWWSVRVTTAGVSLSGSGQSGFQKMVLPVGTAEEVLTVLEALLPGIGDEPHEREDMRDGLSGSAEGFTRAGRRAAAVLWFGTRRNGIRIDDTRDENASLRIRRGALTRSFVVLPLVRAQSVAFARPFAHRILGLATLQAHTVLGPVHVGIRGLALDDARALFNQLSSTAWRVQGEEAAGR